ncbi:hypothetical protein [Pectobacterium polaris]|uniref:hypothetical protein n=1 Tax=Pectobacterium polaris TaxID=2042057 RepID=UPI001F4748A3|nr:hypothetical protein [Pectobacterium polaris]
MRLWGQPQDRHLLEVLDTPPEQIRFLFLQYGIGNATVLNLTGELPDTGRHHQRQRGRSHRLRNYHDNNFIDHKSFISSVNIFINRPYLLSLLTENDYLEIIFNKKNNKQKSPMN